VLISIDTLRADRLPIYGYRKIDTPAITSLAADGVVFEHAWAHSPQTLPSHTSIFTGALPFDHGVRDNMGFVVKPGATTLAGQLASLGYATAGFVSAYVMRQDTGIGQGFAVWDDHLPPTSPEVATGDVQRDGADTITAVERWLDAQASDRFFLFVHLYEPHTPYEPPPKFAALDPYDGEIAYADELVGRLLKSLRRRGWYDPALVVFLSDHGEGLGDHGEPTHGVFAYETTLRIPFIIAQYDATGEPVLRPPRSPRVSSIAVQHVDLLPTVLLWEGKPVPEGLGGRILPGLGGTADSERSIFTVEAKENSSFGPLIHGTISLIRGPYKLIHYTGYPKKPEAFELYNLQVDPEEMKDLFESETSTASLMKEELLDSLADANRPYLKNQSK
jgi:arylsulfatase A-like enzyme